MNVNQQIAKCNQALDALTELDATIWMDPPLSNAIDAATAKIGEVRRLITMRAQKAREKNYDRT